MFKTKELAEKNQSQYVETASILNVNETPKGAPKITTSTPVNSRYGIIKKNKQQQQPLSSAIVKQIRPRRYSLSEMSSLQNKSYSNTRTLKSPGPLLAASLDFKDSISMYEETKSSGLAKRIVTYNEEADKFKKITSQEKYNGIGIFPVVNLFASQSPSASLEKSKRLNIQTPRPDFLSQPHSKSQLSKIFEGLTKSPMQKQLSNAQNNNNNNNKDLSNNDTSTKSVLEALREISRKRIHSNVEQDFTEEVGKRQKTEKQNAAETVITLSGKRSRTDSPPLDNGDSSPTQNPTKKKFCVFDEFAASKSSTDYSTLISKPTAIAPKRKTTCTSTEPVVEPKTVKLVNAETQTVIEEEPKEIPTEVVEEKEETTNVHKPRKINYTLKVFDDAPLENMRKSKLAALLGNIMGKELSIPVQTISSTNIIKSIDEADKIVTVDATNNKELNNFGGKTLKATESAVNNLSTTRSDKHVHFSSVNTIISPEAVKTTEPMKQIVIEPPKEQITVSSSPSKGVNLSPSIIVTTNSSTMNLLVKSPPSVIASSATTFNFGQTTNSTALETNSIISPSKTAGGGFKFDLNQAATTTSTNNILSTSSSSSETTTTTTTMPSTTGFSFGKPAELKKDVPKSTIPTFSFGATASNKATTIINNKESEISKPQFAFGGSKPEAATTTFGISKSVTSSETPLFSGKSTTTNLVTPTFGNLTTSSAGAAASQIFGAPSNSNNNNNKSTELFGMPKNLPTTTTSNSTVSSPIFGTLNSPSSKFGNSFSTSTTAKFVSSTSSSTFGASKTTVSFGQSPKPSSTCAPFNNIPVVTPKTAAATASPFAAPSTFGAVSASVASTIINAPTTTNSSNHFSFGNNAPSTFGVAASAFGKPPSTTQPSSSSSSSFGQTLAESGVYSFGGNTITSSTSSVPTFGSTNSTLAVTTCSAPVFGNNSFGSGAPVNSAPIFGGGGSSTATSSIAVSPVSSSTMFSTGFNNNGAAQSSSSSLSGSFNFTTTTTASSAQFGAFSSTGAATTSSVFGGGGSNVKSGIFKNPSNVFGVAATATNPPPSFGSFGAAPAPSSTTTTMIGSASIFNSGNSAPAFSFGNSASGGLNKPAFGGSSNSFGGGGSFSSTGGFGANNSASAVFGTNTATAKSATGTGGGFGNAASFGTQHQQAVVENKSSFVFGSNNDSSKVTSNAGFGSSAGPVSTFGANLIAPGGFDSTGFGQQQQQQQPANNSGFNFAANSSSAAFKFGGGSASAPNNNNIISEPQKSFSFSAGANPPAFGSMMNNGNTPQFGASSFNANPSLSVPQQQTAGVFNIGSGSSSRPRPQIRAKRRT